MFLYISLVFSSTCSIAQDSVGYIVTESNGWEDVDYISSDTVSISIDTFHYKIQGFPFCIFLKKYIDSTWFQDTVGNRFALYLDTFYKQESDGKPINAINIHINEPRFDTVRDAADPSVILAIDTVMTPHAVKQSADFFFLINRKTKIKSKLM